MHKNKPISSSYDLLNFVLFPAHLKRNDHFSTEYESQGRKSVSFSLLSFTLLSEGLKTVF